MAKTNMAEYMRQRRKTRKAQALKLLGGVCKVCGTTENLEFDHINPKTKVGNVTAPKLIDGKIELFIEEVNKCQLLCKPHHLEKSKANKELGTTYPPAFCGGGAKYGLGCRCDLCKEWKKQYRAELIKYDGTKRE